MCVSVLEASQGTNIPAQQTQHLLRSITSGMSAVVDGRDQILTALKHLLVIKDQSNLAPVNFGCPDGWETAKLDEKNVPTRKQVSA